MTDMVERVAEAIRDVNADTVGLSYSELTTNMARAAIAAMRELTEEMRQEAAYFLGSVDIAPSWNAMIDAALAVTSKDAP